MACVCQHISFDAGLGLRRLAQFVGRTWRNEVQSPKVQRNQEGDNLAIPKEAKRVLEISD